MKLKTITYSESRETVDARGLKQWKKIGVEMELEDNDNEEFVFSCAKGRVEQWHKESNPSTYFQPEPDVLPVHDRGLIEKMEIDIDNATTVKELQSIESKYKRSLPVQLETAYAKKLTQLVSNTN